MQKPHDYYFFSFYRYLNPGFLPLHLAPSRYLFCRVQPDAVAPYTENISAVFERSYHAWLNGETLDNKLPVQLIAQPTQNISDNYLFIKRHFAWWWICYVFFRRLCALKLCLNEPVIFLRTLFAIKRIRFNPPVVQTTQTAIPVDARVSVIIPTRNRYTQLSTILKQLAGQTYKPTEVIVIDQSDTIDHDLKFPDPDVAFHHITTVGGAQASARNAGIRLSSGNYITSVDDDCEIPPGFIASHLQTFSKGADVSVGPYFENTDTAPEKLQQNIYTLAAHLPAGNFMASKTFFNKCGLFDTRFDGLPVEDADLFARAIYLNCKIICNHNAAALHHHLNTGGLRGNSIFPALAKVTAFLHPAVYRFYLAHMPPAFAAEIINSRMIQALSNTLKQTTTFVLFRIIKTVILLLVWPCIYAVGCYHVSRIAAKE